MAHCLAMSEDRLAAGWWYRLVRVVSSTLSHGGTNRYVLQLVPQRSMIVIAGRVAWFFPLCPNSSAVVPAVPSPASSAEPDGHCRAAVHIVAEANLRESMQAQDLGGLFSVDGVRRGSAPYDWTAYRPPSPVESKDKNFHP
ncbi:hypothetical protein LXA43DRAFT_1065509 [Ganoderma leucocontextum]|nr:hypothetical protein LXA43DRAFT_1065509 [Ganoderma leucocontextum]